jgi:hypothetical protein
MDQNLANIREVGCKPILNFDTVRWEEEYAWILMDWPPLLHLTEPRPTLET